MSALKAMLAAAAALLFATAALGAEEAFWVYDHPPVRLFEHREKLSFSAFRDVLCAPPAPSACD